MEHQEMEITCEKNAEVIRKYKNWSIIYLLGSLVFGGFFMIGVGWKVGLGIGIVSFVVFKSVSIVRDRYFIIKMLINNSTISITYLDYKEQKTLEGSRDRLEIKKHYSGDRSNTLSLNIYYDDILQIEQFEAGEWTEKLIDEIIAFLNTTSAEQES